MQTFQENEVVWAKIKGYPWWPGIIEEEIKNIKSKFKVNFIGDKTQ